MNKKFENLLDSGIRNIVQSFHDSFVETNAKFRAKAGLKVTIVRESIGECCSWCSDLAGTYSYDNAPKDIYARHLNCCCVVSTKTEKGTWQDAHTKKEYNSYRENRIARAEEIEKERENLNSFLRTKIEQIKGEIAQNNATNIKEAINVLEKLGMEANGYYEKINLNVANAINSEIEKAFSVFGNLHDKGTLNGLRVLKDSSANYYAAYSPLMKEINLLQHNVQFKKSLSVMKEEAVRCCEHGFWSTPSEMHSIRHELGHAVEHTLSSAQLDKIEILREETVKRLGITNYDFENPPKIDMMNAGTEISYYALKNVGEFVAESVAEYLNGRPRDIAKTVVEIIMKG